MAIRYGDELITLVQIDQPLCALLYGIGLCQASLSATGTRKCYNTRVSCQDSANYQPDTTVTLTFAKPHEGMEQYGYIIPSLESLQITPMKINIGAMDRSLSPFGQREVVNINFTDHLHSDHRVDKYRLERPVGDAGDIYDPYESGSFWGKWMARNPYNEGYPLRIYDGVIGQSLADMQVRHYIIDKISGPNDGTVVITAKDLFSRVVDRKAKAPLASRGELLEAISEVAVSATLYPPGIGELEYPASGRVAIGKEIIAFTRSGDALTLTQRGDLNTIAEDHEVEDKVQVVLSYLGQQVHDILNNLLLHYAGIPSANIPIDAWYDHTQLNFPNLYSANIAEPTPVGDLIGELAEQAGFSIWPDVQDNLIKLKAIAPAQPDSTESITVDDLSWIKDGSLSIKRMPEQRTSQVWIYYGLINPIESIEDNKNYRSRVITADLASESEQQYGTPSIREVFSRWIPQFGRTSALTVGNRIISIFRDPPFRASFNLYAAKDGVLALAEKFSLNTDEVQDDTGQNKVTTHLPIKLIREGDTVSVESQRLNFFVEQPTGASPDVGSSPSGPLVERQLFIDNDTNNFNIRTQHDILYSPASAGDIVRVIIAVDVVVGSNTTGPAMETGNWPSGVEIIIVNYGRISGRGGDAGLGGLRISI